MVAPTFWSNDFKQEPSTVIKSEVLHRNTVLGSERQETINATNDLLMLFIGPITNMRNICCFYNREIPEANGARVETRWIQANPSTLLHLITRLLSATRLEPVYMSTHTSHVALLTLYQSPGE